MFKQHEQYKFKDFLLSIGLFLFYFFLLGFFGKNYDSFPNVELFGYFFKPTSWIIYILIIFILIFRKQKIKSVGITKENLGKSSLLGLLIGILFLMISIAQHLILGSSFKGINFIGYGLIYYLLEIGFLEELMFRGLIQTRVMGFFKNKILAIILTGLLFMFMHIPFQMSINEMSFLEFVRYDIFHLLITFGYHILFSWLYFRYKNIAAPTIVHLFINLSFSMFG